MNFSGRKISYNFLDAFEHILINDEVKLKRLICTSCALST